MTLVTQNKWSAMQPVHNINNTLESRSSHDTRPRKEPVRVAPGRSLSSHEPRTQVALSDWKTQEFGEEEEGPGMASGPVQPIGNSQQLGPWEKRRENRLFADSMESIHETGPFVGINRRLPSGAKKSKESKEAIPRHTVH